MKIRPLIRRHIRIGRRLHMNLPSQETISEGIRHTKVENRT